MAPKENKFSEHYLWIFHWIKTAVCKIWQNFAHNSWCGHFSGDAFCASFDDGRLNGHGILKTKWMQNWEKITQQRWCRVWWHSTNDGGREAGGVALRHLRRPLHHPPHPHHRGQLQQVGDLAAPQTKTDSAPRPASVIDVMNAACLFLFLHQMFCIDVTVTSFAEYGIKYNKGHIAFLTVLRDAHTIKNG